jgi:hypothetical protein
MGSEKVAFLVCFDRCPTTFDMRLYMRIQTCTCVYRLSRRT